MPGIDHGYEVWPADSILFLSHFPGSSSSSVWAMSRMQNHDLGPRWYNGRFGRNAHWSFTFCQSREETPLLYCETENQTKHGYSARHAHHEELPLTTWQQGETFHLNLFLFNS